MTFSHSAMNPLFCWRRDRHWSGPSYVITCSTFLELQSHSHEASPLGRRRSHSQQSRLVKVDFGRSTIDNDRNVKSIALQGVADTRNCHIGDGFIEAFRLLYRETVNTGIVGVSVEEEVNSTEVTGSPEIDVP